MLRFQFLLLFWDNTDLLVSIRKPLLFHLTGNNWRKKRTGYLLPLHKSHKPQKSLWMLHNKLGSEVCSEYEVTGYYKIACFSLGPFSEHHYLRKKIFFVIFLEIYVEGHFSWYVEETQQDFFSEKLLVFKKRTNRSHEYSILIRDPTLKTHPILTNRFWNFNW